MKEQPLIFIITIVILLFLLWAENAPKYVMLITHPIDFWVYLMINYWFFPHTLLKHTNERTNLCPSNNSSKNHRCNSISTP